MICDHFRFNKQSVILPEELDKLQRVFDNTCTASGIKKKSRQAEGLAATIIQLYERGFHDEAQLEQMVARIDFL